MAPFWHDEYRREQTFYADVIARTCSIYSHRKDAQVIACSERALAIHYDLGETMTAVDINNTTVELAKQYAHDLRFLLQPHHRPPHAVWGTRGAVIAPWLRIPRQLLSHLHGSVDENTGFLERLPTLQPTLREQDSFLPSFPSSNAVDQVAGEEAWINLRFGNQHPDSSSGGGGTVRQATNLGRLGLEPLRQLLNGEAINDEVLNWAIHGLQQQSVYGRYKDAVLFNSFFCELLHNEEPLNQDGSLPEACYARVHTWLQHQRTPLHQTYVVLVPIMLRPPELADNHCADQLDHVALVDVFPGLNIAEYYDPQSKARRDHSKSILPYTHRVAALIDFVRQWSPLAGMELPGSTFS